MKKGDVGYLVIEGVIRKVTFDRFLHDDGGREINFYKYDVKDVKGYDESQYDKMFVTYAECKRNALSKLQKAALRLTNPDL